MKRWPRARARDTFHIFRRNKPEEESLSKACARPFSSLKKKRINPRKNEGKFLSLTYRVIRLNKPSRSVNLRRLLRPDDRKLRAASVYYRRFEMRRKRCVSEYERARVPEKKYVSTRHPPKEKTIERERDTRKEMNPSHKKKRKTQQYSCFVLRIAYLCEEDDALLLAADLTATNGFEAVVMGVAVANIFFVCVFCVFFFFFCCLKTLHPKFGYEKNNPKQFLANPKPVKGFNILLNKTHTRPDRHVKDYKKTTWTAAIIVHIQ